MLQMMDTRWNSCVQCCRSRSRFYSCNSCTQRCVQQFQRWTHDATFKLRAMLRAMLHRVSAPVESASTSATSRATVSPCVHHLQHCLQVPDAMLRAMLHRVSAPLSSGPLDRLWPMFNVAFLDSILALLRQHSRVLSFRVRDTVNNIEPKGTLRFQ